MPWVRRRTAQARWRARQMAAAWLAVALMAVPTAASGQRAAGKTPSLAGPFDLRSLAGEWFEVARWGSAWAHRRCVADTRFTFSVIDSRQLAAVRSCTTATGLERRGGRLTASKHGGGDLRGRFVLRLFAWLPAAWAEYGVLAASPSRDWLLIGDRTSDRLAVWSRVVALDESAMAAAIAAGRRHGFDTTRLTPVPHPSGPDAISRGR